RRPAAVIETIGVRPAGGADAQVLEVEVRSASGVVLLRGTLEGEQRFPLSGELRVLAGRPDLVSAASGGAPARPLGPIEAVTWYRFSPEPSPAAQPAPEP
ncbi:MAG: hypothetical protein ACKOPS_17670, partial [Cyanobium sp.]